MVPGTDVVVGQKAGQIQIAGLPEPAGHHRIGPHLAWPQAPGRGNGLVEQPIAHHIEAVVVHAAVHQVAHHQVVLHRHQPLGVEGQGAIGRQGEGGQDPLQIQLAIAGARAVAVAQQVVEAIAVHLAAHQGLDGAAAVAPVLEQVGHGLGAAALKRLEPIPQGGMLPNQSPRPTLVVEPIHFLPRVAQGSMAHVVEQGRCQQDAPMGFEFWVQAHQVVEGQPGDVQHADGVGEAAGFRPMEGEEGGAELADAAEPLERG